MGSGLPSRPSPPMSRSSNEPGSRVDRSSDGGAQGPVERVHPAVPADQAGRAAGAPARLVRGQDRPQPGPARRRLGRLRHPGRLLVAAAHRRLPGGRLHPARLRRPRRRPPPALPLPPRQRPGGPSPRQPAHRDQLRLVGPQAQRPPHQPQPRGPGPRHQHHRAGLHRRPGQRQVWAGPADRPPPGLAVLPPAAPGSSPPAPGQPQSHPPGLGPSQHRRGAAAPDPCRRLPHGPGAGAVAAAGGRLRGRPAGAVRPVPGLFVRSQPQGHAHPHRRRSAGLPAPPGADLAQRAGEPDGGPRVGRAELPDRAPPVPQHAQAQPAPRPAPDPGLLPAPRPPLHRGLPVRLLRPGHPPPPHRRRTTTTRGGRMTAHARLARDDGTSMRDTQSRVPVRTIAATIGMVLLTAAVLLLGWEVRRVLTWIVVAALLAIILGPLVDLTERRLHLRRALATLLVFLVALIALSGRLTVFIRPLASEGPQFIDRVPGYVEQARTGRGPVGRLVRRYNLDEYLQRNQARLRESANRLTTPALGVLRSIFSTVVALVTIVVLTFLMVLQGPNLLSGWLSALPQRRQERVRRVAADCAKAVTGYMTGNLVISIIAGTVTYIVLWIMGVPYRGVVALFVGFADLIPLVGATLGAVVAIAVAALHSLPAAIVVLVVFVVYQQLENHVLQLVSILIGVELFGFLGALLAIPVAGVLHVIGRDLYDSYRGRLKPEPTTGTDEIPLTQPRPPEPGGQQPRDVTATTHR